MWQEKKSNYNYPVAKAFLGLEPSTKVVTVTKTPSVPPLPPSPDKDQPKTEKKITHKDNTRYKVNTAELKEKIDHVK